MNSILLYYKLKNLLKKQLMNKIYLPTFLSLFLLMIFSCSESTSAEAHYSGITETNQYSPNPIGSVDSDDWLVPFSNDSSNFIPSFNAIWPAYPNPTSNQINISFSINSWQLVHIWVDDPPEEKTIELVNKILAPGHYQISFDGINGNSDRKEGILRLFFELPEDPSFNTVHGDIQFKS